MNSLTPTVTKTERVSAYSEPQVENQQKIAGLTVNDRLSATTRKSAALQYKPRRLFGYLKELASFNVGKLLNPDLCIFYSLSFCNTVITYSHSNKGLLLLLLPGLYQNSCPPRNNCERQQMPRYQPSARDYYRRNVSEP